MEAETDRRDKNTKAMYWESAENALELVYLYLRDRMVEVDTALESLETEDPYLLGYEDGFRSGFNAAARPLRARAPRSRPSRLPP